MKAIVIWAVIGVLLTGCVGATATADTFPLNNAAKRLGPIRATFVRTGSGEGPVTITMGDGEVLTGRYRVTSGTSLGYAASGPWLASALIITDGPVQFVASGPKT